MDVKTVLEENVHITENSQCQTRFRMEENNVKRIKGITLLLSNLFYRLV